MERDEVGTLRTLTAYRVIIDRLIASHRGRIFNTAGDSVLADFASAVDAVQCAVAVQDAIAKVEWPTRRRPTSHVRKGWSIKPWRPCPAMRLRISPKAMCCARRTDGTRPFPNTRRPP